MERIVEFSAAFDRRHPDPKQNYGIHGVELRMILKGAQGAVQFLLYTQWHLPAVTEEILDDDTYWGNRYSRRINLPMPADLGYHSPKPIYDGQEPVEMKCPYVKGGICYYDGSGLNAHPVYDRLLEEGDKGVWAALEDYYTATFGGLS